MLTQSAQVVNMVAWLSRRTPRRTVAGQLLLHVLVGCSVTRELGRALPSPRWLLRRRVQQRAASSRCVAEMKDAREVWGSPQPWLPSRVGAELVGVADPRRLVTGGAPSGTRSTASLPSPLWRFLRQARGFRHVAQRIHRIPDDRAAQMYHDEDLAPAAQCHWHFSRRTAR